LIALAARYTGEAVRGWDDWDGLDIHPPLQISDRFGYSFGKTRDKGNVKETGEFKSGSASLQARLVVGKNNNENKLI
jgi:hypothetical protein